MSYLKFDEDTLQLVEVEEHESETTLEFLYRELDCTLVNKVSCTNEIDIWVDDESLNTGNYNMIHTITNNKHPNSDTFILVGKLLFGTFNDEGDTIPLNEEQTRYVRNNITIESVSGNEYLAKMQSNNYNDGI
ncbi:DUF3846 domain-containing protein [Staphylococcus gallinarum]|uniref:DUF3846 domain-containing protein n=1 Tax=Staphylococcus gallinarum TaxID=1293 RepID=UPI0030C0B1FE